MPQESTVSATQLVVLVRSPTLMESASVQKIILTSKREEEAMYGHPLHKARNRILVGISHLILFTGCTVDSQEIDEGFGTTSSNLAAINSNSLWNQSQNVVNVCWSSTGKATQKNKIRDAIEATWKAHSGLIFNWPATTDTVCPVNPSSSWMPIQILSASSYGGKCQFGYGGRLSQNDCGGVTCQCYVNDAYGAATPLQEVAKAAVHEVGHGLGLAHEHKRKDRPVDIADTCADPNDTPESWVSNEQYTKDTTLKLLTPYDGLGSIMSYCIEPSRDGATVIEADVFRLGTTDRLGIEMLYPFNLSRKPVLLGGVQNSSGSVTVVRSDVTTTLNIDWVARGALTSSLSNIHWKDNNGIFSSLPSPTITITSSRTIELELDDPLGRHHSWTATSVIASNALHTAILLPRVL